MKTRTIPAGDVHDDMLAGAMALGLISAGVSFEYDKRGCKHYFWVYESEIPEACQPEKWVTEDE